MPQSEIPGIVHPALEATPESVPAGGASGSSTRTTFSNRSVEGEEIMDGENRPPTACVAGAPEFSLTGPFSPLPDTVADGEANAAASCEAPAGGLPFLLADADAEGIEDLLAAAI